MEKRRFARVELRRDNLRFPFPERFVPRLEGREIHSLKRRAKYILADLDDGATLLIHLGMTGRFTIEDGEGAGNVAGAGVGHNAEVPREAHEHVVFHMGKSARIGYCDPRRFGIMDLIEPGGVETHFLMAKLGVEPLGPDLTPDYIKSAFDGKKAPLKAALLDQR
ncbi:UNVERIFIED_CONTAM: hypothetical protein GTU68_009468, partial [Idotea baltica]|nr:hypothetical protein [Idotea baltica]